MKEIPLTAPHNFVGLAGVSRALTGELRLKPVCVRRWWQGKHQGVGKEKAAEVSVTIRQLRVKLQKLFRGLACSAGRVLGTRKSILHTVREDRFSSQVIAIISTYFWSGWVIINYISSVITSSNHTIAQMSAAITPDSVRSITHQLPLYFLHPDPDQPFLNRGDSGQSNRNNLETILMMRSSTHLTVPCLVTVPDLNVTLHTVWSH